MKSLSRRDRIVISFLLSLAAFVFLFMALQMSFYERYIPIESFFKPEVKVDPNLLVTPDELAFSDASNANEIKSIARDQNDTRLRSDENWTQNTSTGDPYQNAKQFEQQLFSEAGGQVERDKIQKEMYDRKQTNAKTNPATTQNSKGNKGNGNNIQYSGDVMVEFRLDNRTAFENNMWYVRNPGYTCGYGAAGKVVVKISVDKTGRVMRADYDPSKSNGANPCMIEQSVKYANKSKFNFKDNAPEIQNGYIVYKFISQ